MTPSQALSFLRGTTPKEFLWNCIVTTASRTNGLGQFTIDKVAASAADKHEMFKITEQVNQQNGHPFGATSVPMLNIDTLGGGIFGTQLPNAGDDIMVTGMITSCAFMYSTDKNNMYCSHIEPTRAPNPNRVNRGLELGVALSGGGATFANYAGAVAYYSAIDYQNIHHVNVIGIRKGDGWSIYVQAIQQPGGTIVFSKKLI